MSNHTESRPSFSGIGVGRPSRPSRDAIVSPPPLAAAATMPSKQSHELVDQLQSLVDDMKRAKDSDGREKESLVENVKRIAKAVQNKVAKLGGIATPKREDGADASRPSRPSRASFPGGRMSISPSLDGYRPGTDVVAPISVRPNAMELIWVCGDCGAHFPRRTQPPETCSECGAPKTNFYSPIED